MILSAATITLVAAFGVSGCSGEEPRAPASSVRAMPSATGLVPAPTVAPLPPADALVLVLYQLADTSISAEQKVGLVQYATAEDRPALTNFGEALKASGFDPLDVRAVDLTWAGDPGHVVATVTIGSPNPAVKAFTYPMEFCPIQNRWQLSRRTADQLLPLVTATRPPG